MATADTISMAGIPASAALAIGNAIDAVNTAATGAIVAASLTVTGAVQAGTTLGISTDVLLARDAANTLALRNAANAQTFRVYNTYTDASNYERGVFDWSTTSNTLTIGTAKLGTGTARDLTIVSASNITMSPANGVIFMALGSTLVNTSRYRIQTPSDGVITLTDNAATSFSRLQFGGTTSSFPALRRTSTALEVVLADNSAYADFNGANITAAAGTAIPAGGTAGAGLKVSSTSNFGVFFGSGAPTLSAAQGSIYLRSDGSSTSTRMYVNTNGSTTWTAVTTAT